ncbi:MAG: heme exporter protein CcmB [Flexilinea sp.]|jgi:heme exporter protein B
MKAFIHNLAILIKKDLTIERHTREIFLVMFIFALSILFIINFALDTDIKSRSSGAAGIIWVILVISGQLSLNQIMNLEKQGNMLEALLASPVSMTAVYFSKTITCFLGMYGMSLIIFPLYSIFYNVSLNSAHILWISALGCWGYASLGVLISTMTIQTRMRDILLPVLFFPVIIPLIVAAVRVTESVFLREPIGSAMIWISQLIAFDVIFTAVGMISFDYIIED